MNLSESIDRARTEATETSERGHALAMEGLRALSSGIVRAVGRVDGLDAFLRLVGLTRRSSTRLAATGSFGVGLAVGAGLGVLFAPAAGDVTRQKLAGGARQLLLSLEAQAETVAEAPMQKAREVASEIGSKVEQAAHKTVESLKTQADDPPSAVADTAKQNGGRDRSHHPS